MVNVGRATGMARDLLNCLAMVDTSINIVASKTNWAWPNAVRSIFEPRGVNLLVAEGSDDFMEILRLRRVSMAIMDSESDRLGGLAMVKVIRARYPSLPCVLLAGSVQPKLLSEALLLGVFSVIEKPVDMAVLQGQLNRLFVKQFNSTVFS